MDSESIHPVIPQELISKTEVFDSKTPITRIISSVDRYGAVVINKNSKYFGIIDNKAIHNFSGGFRVGTRNNNNAEGFAIKAPVITNSNSVDEVLHDFYRVRTKALPYSTGYGIKGILKRFTLLKMLLSLGFLNDIPVSEVMTTPVIAIDANSNVSQARAVMRANKISRLVVVQKNRLFGIITNYDIAHNYLQRTERLPEMKTQIYNPSNIPLSSVANKNPIVIDYSKNLSDVSRIMIEKNISSLIVVRNARPIGILTVFDIFGSLVSRRRIEENQVFISGLDENTYEYEEEIRDALKAFMRKAEKIKGAKALYINLNIKKIKGDRYEMHSRLSMEKQGTIYINASDFTLEKTLNLLLNKLMKEVKKKKERYLSIRKVTQFKEGMDQGSEYE